MATDHATSHGNCHVAFDKTFSKRNHIIRAMKPAVYILCGIPFSGKSTLAHILAAQRGWVHVDVDAIAESLLDSSDSDVTEEQWTASFATSYEQVARSLAQGQSVVHDATNFGRPARDHVRAIARQFDAAAYVIYLAVPIHEADQRRRTNQALPRRHQVSDMDFCEVVNRLEPPTADESVLIFDGTLDVETWIKRFISD